MDVDVAIARCVLALRDDSTLRRATYYLSPRDVVKATRQHQYDARVPHETYIVTVGRPNYAERKSLKLQKLAGVVFPNHKLALRFWPQRRKAA